MYLLTRRKLEFREIVGKGGLQIGKLVSVIDFIFIRVCNWMWEEFSDIK